MPQGRRTPVRFPISARLSMNAAAVFHTRALAQSPLLFHSIMAAAMLLLIMMHVVSLGPARPQQRQERTSNDVPTPSQAAAPLQSAKRADAGCAAAPRSFVPQESRAEPGLLAHDMPPLLWSFPGSGNTVARLLLEHGSGYYTGEG